MRTETTSKGKITVLSTEDILSYLLKTDDKLDTIIKCRTKDEIIITSDKEVYEALGSLKAFDGFSLPTLVKFFESVTIRSADKDILTHEKVEELRKAALSRR